MSQNSKNFERYRKQLEMLLVDTDESAKRVVSRMADLGLNVTKKNTPVGKYSKYVFFYTKWGKQVSFTITNVPQGGTLRRGWIKSKTRKAGNAWVSGYFNNVEYGIYVNNGHRIVNRFGETTGYVKGKRMLEQGINEANNQWEQIFNDEIARVKRKGGW